jgi:hypothetical protein
MPTSNPRITITLQPRLAAQFRRLSELTGDSQSKLINGVLESSADTWDSMISIFEAASKAKEELPGVASVDIRRAQKQIEAQLGLVLDDAEKVAGDLLTEVEKVKRRSGRRPKVLARDARSDGVSAGVTPLSNRGVRSTSQARKGRA